MKYTIVFVFLIAFPLILAAGGEPETTVDADGDYRVAVYPGENYRHPFPLFLGIRLKNPPQMALWAETLDGEFLGTLMVTEKIADRDWARAPQDPTPAGEIRRPEALPVWTHRMEEAAGRISPPDAVSRATPKGAFDRNLGDASLPGRCYLYFEVNHSTDFNASYPADAEQGTASYSGGPWGGGQPALVYRALLNTDLLSGESLEFELAGHSSPSGADGGIYPDLSGIDSALAIIESVRIERGRAADRR